MRILFTRSPGNIYLKMFPFNLWTAWLLFDILTSVVTIFVGSLGLLESVIVADST